MRFLLSNDDGYQAPGLHALAKALQKLGDVAVVAPDRDRSGASNSLTLDRPLRVLTDPRGFQYVNGTPTDCVHLAITGLLDQEPDMVISGINSGANLGDDVLYSGTVAAAMEGHFLGCPALALSLATESPHQYGEATDIAVSLIKALQKDQAEGALLLNVNIPYIDKQDITGYALTRLGQRHRSEAAKSTTDPKGRTVYWVGPAGRERDAGEGTDFHAIKNKQVSITPLQLDLTAHQSLPNVKERLAAILSLP